jgi:hypothetical protein
MNARLARVVPGSLCALLLTATAVYAADMADAQAAKSNAWSYKNGADQWSGLFRDHEANAEWACDESVMWRTECIDWGIWQEGDENDLLWRGYMVEGDAHWSQSYQRRVNGDVYYASAQGYYNGGVNDMTLQQWDSAVSNFNEAAKPMPALRYQAASQQYAEGIDHATPARTEYEAARDFAKSFFQ